MLIQDFSDIVRNIGEETVNIYTKDNNLVIISGNAVFNIRWIDSSSFPKLPDVEKKIEYQLKLNFLRI